jgi:hypothetical protein
VTPAGCAAVFPPAARPAYGRAVAGVPRGTEEAAVSNTTRRWRVITARACIVVSFACLLLLVAYPPLRQHAAARGAGIAVSAVVSILGSLAYLRSRR